ncbi:ABC-2 family transporter protein [Enterococcus sp. LJL51]|uniref:ABC-2 family transporter protein n=1 Tax=Enterococcus sp. LJL51 TaxID=3416656 RepID=UPI003CE9E513
MKTIVYTVKILYTLMKVQLSSAMIYRFNFWGAFLIDSIFFGIQLLFFHVIAEDGMVGTWNIHQITVFIGTFITLDALYMATYFFGILSLPEKIRTGGLDQIFVKPVNALLYIAFGNINISSFLLFLLGIGIVSYGASHLEAITAVQLFQYIILFLLMYWLMFSLMLLLRSAAFWLTRISAINTLENTILETSFRLPYPAITSFWKLILLIVLPYGLIANMPAMALFGTLSWQHWLLCFTVPSAFSFLSLRIWRIGCRQYDSVSS